jgi:hypothetical protein
MVKIYCLKDPNTLEIRYIGKTIQELKKRLSGHLMNSKHKQNTSHTSCWIKNLLNDNKIPIIELIENVDDSIWIEREQYWIDFYNSYKEGYNGRPDVTNTIKINKSQYKGGKSVSQFDLLGNKINEYESAREASTKLNVSYKHISACCLGKRVTVKKQIWRFTGDDFNKYDTKPKIDVSKKSITILSNGFIKYLLLLKTGKSNKEIPLISSGLN